MDWIPNTIDAFTRFGKEMGGFWLIGMTLAVVIAMLLWRHSGAVVKLLQEMVVMRRDDMISRQDLASVMGVMNRELKNQTDELGKQTALAKLTNEKIANWPSDFPARIDSACKYPIDPVVVAHGEPSPA